MSDNNILEKINAAWKFPDVRLHQEGDENTLEDHPAYRQGYENGLMQAKIEFEQLTKIQAESHQLTQAKQQQILDEKIDNVNLVLTALNQPHDQITQALESEVLILLRILVEKLYQKQIESDPDQLLKIIIKAKQQLPLASTQIQLCCHPEDVQRIQCCDKFIEFDGQLRLVEDNRCAIGEFILKTDKSIIDGRLKQRITCLLQDELENEG